MLITDLCTLRLGQRVTVAPTAKYANEWPGEYLIVGMALEYRDRPNEINITIATPDDIAKRHGSTDGWGPSDLIPVTAGQ